MRFVIGVVLALSVGIGAYLGSARAAGSATAHARVVHLRIGDIAVAGQVQCRAIKETRSNPTRPDYLRCSKGPLGRAASSVMVTPNGVNFSNNVGKALCFLAAYAAQPGYPHPIFSTDLRCQKGPHAVSSVQIEVRRD